MNDHTKSDPDQRPPAAMAMLDVMIRAGLILTLAFLCYRAVAPFMVLIGLGLFAHQGFSTNVFGMTADIIPATRVASVIALGAVAGNLSGTAIIEFAGYSLGSGMGYVPLFAICGSA